MLGALGKGTTDIAAEGTLVDRRRAALNESWLRELDRWLALEAATSDTHRIRLGILRLARGDLAGAREALRVGSAPRVDVAAFAELLVEPAPVAASVGPAARVARRLSALWRLVESDDRLPREIAAELSALGAGAAAGGLIVAERIARGGAAQPIAPDVLTSLIEHPSGVILWPALLRLHGSKGSAVELSVAGSEYARMMSSKEAQSAVAAATCLAVAHFGAPLEPCLNIVGTMDGVHLTLLQAALEEPAGIQGEIVKQASIALRKVDHPRPTAFAEAAALVSIVDPNHGEILELYRKASESSVDGLRRLLFASLSNGRPEVLAWALRRVAAQQARLRAPFEVAAQLVEAVDETPPAANADALAVGLALARALAASRADEARALLAASPTAFRGRDAIQRINQCVEAVDQGALGPSSGVQKTRARRQATLRSRRTRDVRFRQVRDRWRLRLASELRSAGVSVWAPGALSVASRGNADGAVSRAELASRIGRIISGWHAYRLLGRVHRAGGPLLPSLLDRATARLALEQRLDDAADLILAAGPGALSRPRVAVVALGRLGRWAELARLLLEAASLKPGPLRARMLVTAGQIQERHLSRPGEATALYAEAQKHHPVPVPSALWIEQQRREGNSPAMIESMLVLAGQTRERSNRLELYLRCVEILRDEVRDGARAVAAAEAARAIAPWDGRVLFLLAGLYESIGAWEQFVEVSEAHLQLELPPDHRAMLHHRVACGYEAGLSRFEDAEHHYRQALALDPSPVLYQSLRALLERMGRWAEVVQQLRAELPMWKAPAERASLLTRIGEICERHLNDIASARDAYTVAIHDDPASVSANRALLELSLKSGEYQEAYEISAFLVRTSGARFTVPELCRLLNIRAQLAARLRSPKEAIASLALAIDLQPQELSHFDAFVDILQRHPQEAVDELIVERALSTQREIGSGAGRARALLLSGIARGRTGDVTLAEDHFRQAVELDPGLLRAREGLTALLSALGREREAQELWTSWIVDAAPGDAAELLRAALRWTRRWIDDAAAEVACRKWLERMPNSTDLTIELAQLLAVRGAPEAIKTAAAAAQRATGPGGIRAGALHARLSLGRGTSYGNLFKKLEEAKSPDPNEWMAVSGVAQTPADKVSVLARALSFVPPGKDQERVRRRLATVLEELGDTAQVIEMLTELDPIGVELVLESTLARMRAEVRSGAGRNDSLETMELMVSVDPFYIPGLREASRVCIGFGARDLGLRMLDVIAVAGALTDEEASTREELRRATGASPPKRREPIGEFLSPLDEELRNEPFDTVWKQVGSGLVSLNLSAMPEHYPLPAFDAVHEQLTGVLEGAPDFVALDGDEVRFFGAPFAAGVPVDQINRLTDTDLLFLAGWAFGTARAAGPEIASLPVIRRVQLLSAIEEMFAGRAVGGAPTKKELELLSQSHTGTTARPLPRRWWNLVAAQASQLGLMLCGDLSTSIRWLTELAGPEVDTPALIRFSPPALRLVKYYLSPAYLQWRRRTNAWTA